MSTRVGGAGSAGRCRSAGFDFEFGPVGVGCGSKLPGGLDDGVLVESESAEDVGVAAFGPPHGDVLGWIVQLPR